MSEWPWTGIGDGAGTFTGPEHETEHSVVGQGYALSEFPDSTRLLALLDILLDGTTTIGGGPAGPTGVQSVEDVAWQLYTERGLEAIEDGGPAEGVQLDTIGKIVGQERLAAFVADVDYRVALRLRIAANRSNGYWSELFNLFELSGITEPVGAVEFYPATIHTEATGYPSLAWAEAVWFIMRDAKPAGVRWDWLWSDESETDVFTYSEDLAATSTDVDRGYRNLAVPPNDTGGHYMGLMT